MKFFAAAAFICREVSKKDYISTSNRVFAATQQKVALQHRNCNWLWVVDGIVYPTHDPKFDV